MSKTILVVDGFEIVRNFVCSTLQKRGYRTLGANNGCEAYEILMKNAGNVNLVLTDFHMPDCTGQDLLKKIKENPVTTKVPVIFLTVELSDTKLASAKEAGLFAWIRKPYRSEKFFSQIESAFASS